MLQRRAWWMTAVGAVLVMTMAAPERAQAEELSFPNRVLKSTYMKTRDDNFALTHSFRNIFSATNIVCPGTEGTCTVRIEVSSEWLSDQPPTRWRAIRLGTIVPIVASPGVVFVEPLRDTVSFNSHTFSWVISNLGPGSHLIGVQAETLPDHLYANDFAEVRKRTLTITVYKP
jgi:hypothetical protein